MSACCCLCCFFPFAPHLPGYEAARAIRRYEAQLNCNRTFDDHTGTPLTATAACATSARRSPCPRRLSAASAVDKCGMGCNGRVHVPIICLSGNVRMEHHQLALRAGQGSLSLSLSISLYLSAYLSLSLSLSLSLVVISS